MTDLEKLCTVRIALEKDIKEVDEEIELLNQTIETHRSSIKKIDNLIADNCDNNKKTWLSQHSDKRVYLKKLLDDIVNEKEKLFIDEKQLTIKIRLVSKQISILENATCQRPPAYNPQFKVEVDKATSCPSPSDQTFRMTDLEKLCIVRIALEKDIKEVDEEIELLNQTIETHRNSIKKIDNLIADNCDNNKKTWLSQQSDKQFYLKKLLNDIVNEKEKLTDKQFTIKIRLVSKQISVLE